MTAQPPATTRDDRTDGQSPELTTLRRLGVWIPVGGIGLLVGLLPVLFPESGWHGALIPYLITMGIVTVGAYLFSRFVFRVVQQKEKEILRHNRELAALNTVGAVLNESLDLDTVLNRSLEKVLEVTDADAGEVFLWDDSQEELVQIAVRGIFPEAFREITRFKRNQGLLGITAEEDRAIVVENLPDDPRFLRKQVSGAGFHSFAAVPLRSKGSVLGVMGIAWLQPGRFSDKVIDLLGVLGNQIGIAIENARLYARLREMSTLEERQRIAREMHDGLAQELGYLRIKISELEQDVGTEPPEANRRQLAHMKAVVDKAYEDVRQAIFGLRMMVSRGLGFVPTLTEYLHDFSEQTDIKIELQIADPSIVDLAPQAEVQLIRIVQEALTNVRKHSRASRAWVIVKAENGTAKITVGDNGRGFDPDSHRSPSKSSFGLEAMQERADLVHGTLEVASEPDQGTEIIVRLPLQRKETGSGPAVARLR